MKFFKFLLVIMFCVSVAGCGGATFDECVEELTSNAQKEVKGQMSDVNAKKAGELACAVCKDDSKACKQIIDALK